MAPRKFTAIAAATALLATASVAQAAPGAASKLSVGGAQLRASTPAKKASKASAGIPIAIGVIVAGIIVGVATSGNDDEPDSP